MRENLRVLAGIRYVNFTNKLFLEVSIKPRLIPETSANFNRYATSIFPIMHFIYPPKFCVTFVFHFSWVLQPSQAKLKTMPLKNFWGQIRCIMGNVQVAYWLENPRATASNKRKQYRML